MEYSLATVLGTAALGFLKGKLGSSVKIKREYSKFLKFTDIFFRIYATNLDYLGIDLDNLFESEDSIILKDNDQSNRLFLLPIKGSPIIKSAGVFMESIEVTDEDEDLGNLYSIYWLYVIEPYDENLILNQKTINHLQDIFHKLCFAFNETTQKVMSDDVGFDEWGNEFRYDNVEDFIEHKGDIIRSEINDMSFISVPEHFIIDNEGRKKPLRYNKNNVQTLKLRKR